MFVARSTEERHPRNRPKAKNRHGLKKDPTGIPTKGTARRKAPEPWGRTQVRGERPHLLPKETTALDHVHVLLHVPANGHLKARTLPACTRGHTTWY